jgi:hypothetical protein
MLIVKQIDKDLYSYECFCGNKFVGKKGRKCFNCERVFTKIDEQHLKEEVKTLDFIFSRLLEEGEMYGANRII